MANFKDNNADLGNQTIEGTESPYSTDGVFVMPQTPGDVDEQLAVIMGEPAAEQSAADNLDEQFAILMGDPEPPVADEPIITAAPVDEPIIMGEPAVEKPAADNLDEQFAILMGDPEQPAADEPIITAAPADEPIIMGEPAVEKPAADNLDEQFAILMGEPEQSVTDEPMIAQPTEEEPIFTAAPTEQQPIFDVPPTEQPAADDLDEQLAELMKEPEVDFQPQPVQSEPIAQPTEQTVVPETPPIIIQQMYDPAQQYVQMQTPFEQPQPVVRPQPQPQPQQQARQDSETVDAARAMMEQARRLMEEAQAAQRQAQQAQQAAQLQAQVAQAAQAAQAARFSQPQPSVDNSATEAARTMMQQAQMMMQQAQQAQQAAQLQAQVAQASRTVNPAPVTITDPYAQKEVDRLKSELDSMRELVNKLTFSIAQNPSGQQNAQPAQHYGYSPEVEQYRKLEGELERMRREIIEKDLRDREKELERKQKEAENNNVKDIRPEMIQMSDSREVAPAPASQPMPGGEYIPLANGVYYSTKDKQVYVMTLASGAAAANPTIERPKPKRAAPARPARATARRRPMARRRPIGGPRRPMPRRPHR